MSRMRLAKTIRYPAKGCGSDEVTSSALDTRGLAWNHHWMLANERGVFLSQRSHPQMARIRVRAMGEREGAGQVTFSVPGNVNTLIVPGLASCGEPFEGQVQVDRCMVVEATYQASAWFSAVLGQPVRLVRLADGARRERNKPCYPPGTHTRLSDRAPFNCATITSLDALNQHITGGAVPYDRVRTNFLIEGSEPWEEDTWLRVRIGGCIFRFAQPCERCKVPDVDQTTGKPDPDRRVWNALEAIRWNQNRGGVDFGIHLVLESGAGTIRVGDDVDVLEWIPEADRPTYGAKSTKSATP